MKKTVQKLAACILLVAGIAANTFAQTWEAVGTTGFSAGEARFTSLAFNPISGEPYVAYKDYGNSGKPSVMKFNGTDWVYVGEAGFSASTTVFLYISLAFSSTGEPYVAFRDNTNSNKATVMKFDGAAWVNVGTPGFSSGTAAFVSLAISPSGEPYVAFEDNENSLKATVIKYDGTAWVNVGTAGFTPARAAYTFLSFSPTSGEPYVVFQDYANSIKATVMKFDGTAWVNVGTVGFSAGSVNFTSLAFSPTTGEPYVAYSEGGATVMKFDGTAWVNVGTPEFSAGQARDCSLAISNSGEPYMAYQDVENSDKATVMKFDGSGWLTLGTAGFSTGIGHYNSLKFSSSGEPYLAYGNTGGATVMKFANTTGINDNAAFGIDISLYPNPAKETVAIGNLPVSSTVEITDIAGKAVYRFVTETENPTINIAHFVNGVYIVQIENKGAVVNRKLVVNK